MPNKSTIRFIDEVEAEGYMDAVSNVWTLEAIENGVSWEARDAVIQEWKKENLSLRVEWDRVTKAFAKYLDSRR